MAHEDAALVARDGVRDGRPARRRALGVAKRLADGAVVEADRLPRLLGQPQRRDPQAVVALGEAEVALRVAARRPPRHRDALGREEQLDGVGVERHRLHRRADLLLTRRAEPAERRVVLLPVLPEQQLARRVERDHLRRVLDEAEADHLLRVAGEVLRVTDSDATAVGASVARPFFAPDRAAFATFAPEPAAPGSARAPSSAPRPSRAPAAGRAGASGRRARPPAG